MITNNQQHSNMYLIEWPIPSGKIVDDVRRLQGAPRYTKLHSKPLKTHPGPKRILHVTAAEMQQKTPSIATDPLQRRSAQECREGLCCVQH